MAAPSYGGLRSVKGGASRRRLRRSRPLTGRTLRRILGTIGQWRSIEHGLVVRSDRHITLSRDRSRRNTTRRGVARRGTKTFRFDFVFSIRREREKRAFAGIDLRCGDSRRHRRSAFWKKTLA